MRGFFVEIRREIVSAFLEYQNVILYYSNMLKNIEFLRIIAILSIILFHAGGLVPVSPATSAFKAGVENGRLAVDLFFILAGFFMFYHFRPQDTWLDFIKKKLARLYPMVVLFACLDAIFSFAGCGLYDQVFRLLLLDDVGLTLHHLGDTWYVSALFWTLAFYKYAYDLLYRHEKVFRLLCAVSILFCYSFLTHALNGHILGNSRSFAYVFNIGLMRSFAGVGVGYFLSVAYLRYQIRPHIASNRAIWGIAELLLFGWLVLHWVGRPLEYDNNWLIILASIGLIWLFLIKKGWFSQFFENNLSVWGGKYTYAVFIVHMCVLYLFYQYAWKGLGEVHFSAWLLAAVTCSCLAGIVCYHGIEKPVKEKLLNYWFAQKTKKPN